MSYKENYPSKLLEEAVDAISSLPGVGRRSALRLALHLLRQPAENVRHFTTCEEGLEKAGFTIVTKDWMDRYDACKADNTVRFYRQIREEAEKKKIPVIAAALGKTPDEPEYDFSIDSDADVCAVRRSTARMRESSSIIPKGLGR